LRRFSQLTTSVCWARVMPTYISRRSSWIRRASASAVAVFVGLEGQQPLVDAGQHHMRPFQPLGGVQGGERDHVLVLLALRNGGNERDGLRHFQQGLGSRSVVRPPVSSIWPPQRCATQSQKSITLPQRAAATLSLSSLSIRCCS
jgi:hypothetical protein